MPREIWKKVPRSMQNKSHGEDMSKRKRAVYNVNVLTGTDGVAGYKNGRVRYCMVVRGNESQGNQVKSHEKS